MGMWNMPGIGEGRWGVGRGGGVRGVWVRGVGATFRLVLDECCLVFHHRVHCQLLIVLGCDDSDRRPLAGRLDRHLLHNLHL